MRQRKVRWCSRSYSWCNYRRKWPFCLWYAWNSLQWRCKLRLLRGMARQVYRHIRLSDDSGQLSYHFTKCLHDASIRRFSCLGSCSRPIQWQNQPSCLKNTRLFLKVRWRLVRQLWNKFISYSCRKSTCKQLRFFNFTGWWSQINPTFQRLLC